MSKKVGDDIDRAETMRRHAEEEIHKLLHAIEQSPVVIMITCTAGNIEYVNPKFTQITGYTKEEVIGKNPRILKSGETPPEEYKRLWDTITSGGTWQGELHNRKKSGKLFLESAAISPVRNAEGTITNFIAVKEGLRGAFCFPVEGNREISGVIDFLCRTTRQADNDLLNMMIAIGRTG